MVNKINMIRLGFCALLATGVCTMVANRKNGTEEYMAYVKENNKEKYIEMLEKGYGEDKLLFRRAWRRAEEEVKDSLYLDSIARANYAKGAQMVRDSIAKAKTLETPIEK